MALGLILLFSLFLRHGRLFRPLVVWVGIVPILTRRTLSLTLALSPFSPASGRHSSDGHGSLRATDGVFLSRREAAIKENSWWFEDGSGIKTTHLLLTFALPFCTLYIDSLVGRTLKW